MMQIIYFKANIPELELSTAFGLEMAERGLNHLAVIAPFSNHIFYSPI
jgi:hypothetical protein